MCVLNWNVGQETAAVKGQSCLWITFICSYNSGSTKAPWKPQLLCVFLGAPCIKTMGAHTTSDHWTLGDWVWRCGFVTFKLLRYLPSYSLFLLCPHTDPLSSSISLSFHLSLHRHQTAMGESESVKQTQNDSDMHGSWQFRWKQSPVGFIRNEGAKALHLTICITYKNTSLQPTLR